VGRAAPGPVRHQVGRADKPSRAGRGPVSEVRAVSDDTRSRLRQRLDDYMTKKNLRSTAQRRLIVDTFFEGHPHVTIEDLLSEVRGHDKGIGYATVYRTLKLLAESGVASERRFGDGLSRYELADDDDDHHDHLICVACGTITEFEEPRIEKLQDGVAQRYGFLVTSHRHELYGTCAACQKREARGRG
jgi:Fur family ferric uptake transcriptional regulator